MDERAWNSCQDPEKMLAFLRNAGKGTERRLRLFCAAVCRRLWHLLPDEAHRNAVLAAEQSADGLPGLAGARAAAFEAGRAAWHGSAPLGAGIVAENYVDIVRFMEVRNAVYETTDPHPLRAAEAVLKSANTAWWHATMAGPGERVSWPEFGEEYGKHTQAHADLLRDIFGPLPFRPIALASSLLTWRDGIIPRLAQAIYEERAFDRLPILGDALEEAGVTDPDILGHCRQQGTVHARGCFVLDLLLGKE